MLRLDNRRSTKIDGVFVIALFTMFAVTAFLLILIGAKQYQRTADTMDANYESRTISSYLTEKIRQQVHCLQRYKPHSPEALGKALKILLFSCGE